MLTPGQEIELPPPKPKATTKKTEPDLEAQIANSKVGQQGKTGMDQTATVAGYTGKLADAADPKIASNLQKLEQRVVALQTELPKLQAKIQGEVSKLIDMSTSGQITKAQFFEQLSQQSGKLTHLQSEIHAVEQAMQSLSQLSKGAGLVS